MISTEPKDSNTAIVGEYAQFTIFNPPRWGAVLTTQIYRTQKDNELVLQVVVHQIVKNAAAGFGFDFIKTTGSKLVLATFCQN